jgi:two-component system, OmpR family, phosphate regulon sensor histidine kinase PhoR
LKRRVFTKLLLAFVVLIAVATLVLDVAVRRAWEASLRNEITRSLEEKVRLFADEAQRTPASEYPALVKRVMTAVNARATIITQTGLVLADSEANPDKMENHATRPEFIQALQHGQLGANTRTSHTLGIDFYYVAAPIPGGAVRLAYPLEALKQAAWHVRKTLLVSSLIALLLATLLAAYIAHQIESRLQRIVAFAEKIAAGDFSARLSETSDDEIAIVASALDTTARKLERSFAALETGRKELETLLNSMFEAVIAVGPDRKVRWANGRMNTLVPRGVRMNEALIETLREPNLLAAIDTAMTTHQTATVRASSLRPGRTYDVTVAPMASGGAVAVLHDVTEQVRVEKTRRDFIANVSHELRTPLTSVQGYAESLLDSVPQNEQNAGTREFLEIILKNASRMSRLTQDLLVLARVESGEQRFRFEPVGACDLVREAAETFRTVIRERNVAFDTECGVDDQVMADRDAIHQVFSNLIDNAIKYGGDHVIVGAREKEGAVEFYVRDFGEGIASEHLPRLFERFYRVDKARSRESGGTGLGLAIVKHIVLQHGGQVRAESELGHGSTFFFTLPKVLVPSQHSADLTNTLSH